VSTAQRHDLTVAEVLARYWQFAEQHYRKDGKPTSTLGDIRRALSVVRRLYGHTPAQDFGPLALKAVRQKMVESGVCRDTVNKRTRTIKRVFRWSVAEELLPPAVYHGLSTVEALQRGRTPAPESEGVAPIPEATIQATLAHLAPIVADMVAFQRLTGARPSEVCIIRPCDVDRSGDVWSYRPADHKMAHHGRKRIVFIGPKAQDILRPYLLREGESYCFSPRESEQKRRAKQRVQRKTKVQPSQLNRRKRNPKRKVGSHYTRDSYRRAIHRACDSAGVERWGPNRLRHSCGTEVRQRFGLEAAQVTLGHATADITQVYAERDEELARAVMRKIG